MASSQRLSERKRDGSNTLRPVATTLKPSGFRKERHPNLRSFGGPRGPEGNEHTRREYGTQSVGESGSHPSLLVLFVIYSVVWVMSVIWEYY